MSRRPRLYDDDILALDQRLRALLAAGGSEAEIARYEADRQRLLDLAGDQVRDQREYDRGMAALRREMEARAHGGSAPDDVARVGDRRVGEAATDDAPADEAELQRVEDMINVPYLRDVTADPEADGWGDEPDDRDRVLDEGPGTSIGGLWFTPDQDAPGGVRPMTETELRRVTDRVRATQAEALGEHLDPPPTAQRPPLVRDAADDAGWAR